MRFIDKPDSRPNYFVVTNDKTDPNAGSLNILSPLAQRLTEIEVGEEFTFETEGPEQILFAAKLSEAAIVTQ